MRNLETFISQNLVLLIYRLWQMSIKRKTMFLSMKWMKLFIRRLKKKLFRNKFFYLQIIYLDGFDNGISFEWNFLLSIISFMKNSQWKCKILALVKSFKWLEKKGQQKWISATGRHALKYYLKYFYL